MERFVGIAAVVAGIRTRTGITRMQTDGTSTIDAAVVIIASIKKNSGSHVSVTTAAAPSALDCNGISPQ